MYTTGPVPRPACGPFGYKSARPANRKDCSRSGCQDSPISVSRGGWQEGRTHSGSVGCSVPRTSVRSGTSAVRAFCVSCRRHGKAIDARNSFRIVARNDCAVWSQWSLLYIPRVKSCFPVSRSTRSSIDELPRRSDQSRDRRLRQGLR